MSEYRLKRGPVLVLLAIVGVVGGVYILANQTRPFVTVLDPITVPDAYAGTTYAFDGLVCLETTRVGAVVTGATSSRGPAEVALLRPPEGSRVAVAFPVTEPFGDPIEGLTVPARTADCVRLVVTPTVTGDVGVGQLFVSYDYGPFDLLSRTVEVDVPVTLQVTETGEDPRLAG